jgi:carbamoyl-phosphate synthase small subunit
MAIFADEHRVTAQLILADGKVFSGKSLGLPGKAVGEVVFNTAMTGYQEILSDPSYAEQIICFTYPHIGNVGTNSDDMESNIVRAQAAIIANSNIVSSNYRSTQNLHDFMLQHKIVGITGIDTRALTRHLRDGGAQMGCVVSGDVAVSEIQNALNQHPGLHGADLASVVTCADKYNWQQASWERVSECESGIRIIVLDFGVKQTILRLLVDRGCEVIVMPAGSSYDEILQQKPDGILLSNGPGDPAACYEIQATISQLLKMQIPIFGICLGYQLLALCLGARTVKMKFGHHGANHPVQCLATGRVMITSQNHGFMVDPVTINSEIIVTHKSLFDNSIQGIKHKTKPFFGFQGHPEASPGPQDIESLFDNFIAMIKSC